MRWKLPALLVSVLILGGAAAWGGELDQVRSLIEQGRAQDALAELDAHLADQPADPEAMFLRGLILAENRREPEAEKVFEEVAGLRPDRPEPLNNLAVIQAATGDYDQAVETLKEALRTHPAYRTAYENLTRIYGQLASEAYSRALSVDGAHDRSSVELVLLSEFALEAPAQARLAEVDDSPRGPFGDAAPSAVADSTAPSSALAAALPREPLPTGSGEDQAPTASFESAEASDPGEAEPTTPDEAIEESVRRAREGDAESTPAAGSETTAPAELADVVEAWAGAWSGQQVEDYLGFYSSNFVPAGDMDLEAWREQRRARLTAPEYVRVSVAFLDFEVTDENRALVRFNQSYESNTFSDVVTKTLELVRQGDSWKIVRESVDS